MSVTGTGSQEDPHVVDTWEDLVTQSETAGTSSATHYVKLACDLDLANVEISSTFYWDIKQYVDVDGGGHTISNLFINHLRQYGLININTQNSNYCKLHDITIDNLNYTHTSDTASSYLISSSTDNTNPIENVKINGVLNYTIAPSAIISSIKTSYCSFKFDYHGPKLPTYGFLGRNNTYEPKKHHTELTLKAFLSESIAGTLWGRPSGYSSLYGSFEYCGLFAEIIAGENCITTTAPTLFNSGNKYGYPLNCYCAIKSNVAGLVIPLGQLDYMKPTRLLYQNDGDNIVTIGTDGLNSSFASQLIGITAAQLKNPSYLNSIGFEIAEV